MFTGNTVRLQNFDGQFGLEVLKDCSFSYLGKLPTKLPNRVVPCSTEAHLCRALEDETISGIIVIPELQAFATSPDKGLALAANPMLALQAVHSDLSDRNGFFWKDFESRIDSTAIIHPTAFIESQNVEIGPRTQIGPFSYVGERSIIGADCKIGPHCSFGWQSFEMDSDKAFPQILPHVGGVRIEDNVEFLSHCAVARCAYGGYTSVRKYTKLDSQILVAHDSEIGERVKIAAGVTICGRASIGNDAFLGPGSVISNGVEVGDSAEVSLGAIVTRNVLAGQKVSGNFALTHTRWMKLLASAAR